jgi:uncharacterized protein
MSNKNPVVFYHANCADGTAAAAVAFLKFGFMAEYVPATYSVVPDTDVTDRDVYILDFSFPPSIMMEYIEKANSVYLLDHHESAVRKLEGIRHRRFWNGCCMDRSGVGLTWRFFFPTHDMPLAYQMIEDRDLWKFEIPDSRIFGEWVAAGDKSIERFVEMATFDKVSIAQCIEDIRPLWDYKNMLVSEHAGRAFEMQIAGYTVPVTNCHGMFATDVGEALAKGKPFSVTYHDLGKHRKFSLRSDKDGSNINVAEIAEKFGGGGHRNAAGFTVEMPMVVAE